MLTKIEIEDMGHLAPPAQRWVCEMHTTDAGGITATAATLPDLWKEVSKHYEKDKPKPALKAEAPVAVAPPIRAAAPPPLPARVVPRHPVSPAVTAPRGR